MKNLLKIAEPDEALYREIMLSLGYPKNKVQFLELALMLPFREIKKLKEKNKIEQALLYRAGFIDFLEQNFESLPKDFDFSLRMDKSLWDYKKIRPSNYPDKRLKGIVPLLLETVSKGLVNYFLEKIEKEKENFKENSTNAYRAVNKIMNFKGIGRERKREMFFNIILPFCIAYLEDKNPEIIKFLNTIFSSHPPLSENSLTKKFKFMIGESNYAKLNISTKTYFGILLYIKENLK